MRTIIGNILKANKIFKLINNNDRICVGVSGGKDSMLLLYSLGLIKKIYKRELNWDIEVVGIHLKMNLCHIDYEPIINFWKEQGIVFHIEETDMGDILRANMRKGKIQCSLCSKLKKAILIGCAKRFNCNKVAMGDHADDAIETFFMNMINEGRIATFKPQMYLDKEQMDFIRPLILCREKDIIKAVKQVSNMPTVPCGCPMEGFTSRDTMKDFLAEAIYNQRKTKIAYTNFLVALLNGKEFDLWFKNEDNSINPIDLRDLGINDGTYMSTNKVNNTNNTKEDDKKYYDDLSDFESED